MKKIHQQPTASVSKRSLSDRGLAQLPKASPKSVEYLTSILNELRFSTAKQRLEYVKRETGYFQPHIIGIGDIPQIAISEMIKREKQRLDEVKRKDWTKPFGNFLSEEDTLS